MTDVSIEELLSSLGNTLGVAPNNPEIPWLKCSNGFPTNYLESMGHKGKGIGKNEDGRTSPVKASKTRFAKQTVLIVGTSMIGGLEQNKMSRKYAVKVRSHPGATLPKIKHHLLADLDPGTDHLILQVGTNDAARGTSAKDIFEGILELKTLAENISPGIVVTISCPMIRTDDPQANKTLLEMKGMLMESSKQWGLSIIINDNILEDHLSKKGLHLKQSGTVQLAQNMIAFMRGIDTRKKGSNMIAFTRGISKDV